MSSFLFSGGKNGNNKTPYNKSAASPLSPTPHQENAKTSTESAKSEEQDIQAPISEEENVDQD
eukprot:6941543-Ditylum_brightwellii.AAC.1